MDCFGDIVKYNSNFDKTLETKISRYYKKPGERRKPAELLVTESVNLAALYDISDGLVQKQSWVFQQIYRLHMPVVVSRDASDATPYMWAVQEPNSLTKWSLGKNKTRLAKHFFNTKICGLIAFDDNPIDPMVVYDKGFCQLMSTAIDTRSEATKRQVISKDEIIQFIDGMVDNKHKTHLIIYLITKRINSEESLIKCVYKLTFDTELNDIVEANCKTVINRFTNWTLHRQSAAVLSVSQSDNKSSLFSLNGQTETRLFELSSSSIKPVISVCATTGGSVCLLGKTKSGNFIVELWELIYHSKVAQLELPYEPMPNDSKMFDNTLVITCFQGIVLIPINCETISLSQMIERAKTKNLHPESDQNQELNQICKELSADSIKSFDEFNKRFEDIVRQKNGLISEEKILKILLIGSSKLSENSRNSLKQFFHSLLSLPFNESFMISRLKALKLGLSQVSNILKLLIEMLTLNNYAIVDWISVIIDAHIQLFIINPNQEVIKLIEAIEDRIDGLVDVCKQLGQIKTLFELILTKKSRKPIDMNLPTPKRGEYCIELLRF